MKAGFKHALAGAGAGLLISAAVLFTPANALAKANHNLQKEKDRIENIDKSKTAAAPCAVRGLSVEPATRDALVRRLSGAQVIIEGRDHTFDLGRDKATALLPQLRAPLDIGAVLMEEFQAPGQDSLTSFCTSGKSNLLTQAVAYNSYPRGPHTEYSLMWLLTMARALDMDLVALSPDWSMTKYAFMRQPRPDYRRYIELANPDMLSVVLEQLRLHPGQRLLVEMGAGHVPLFQKLLEAAGVPSVSFEVWAPGMAVGHNRAHGAKDWLAPLLHQADARYRRYLPRLRACASGDVLAEKASPTSDFVLYTNDAPYWDVDYMRLMPKLFAREIRDLESKTGREWMVEQRLMNPAGALCSGLPSP